MSKNECYNSNEYKIKNSKKANYEENKDAKRQYYVENKDARRQYYVENKDDKRPNYEENKDATRQYYEEKKMIKARIMMKTRITRTIILRNIISQKKEPKTILQQKVLE